MARCSKCGHESDLDIYVCDNCLNILKIERIESIPLFKRPEPKPPQPKKKMMRIIQSMGWNTTPSIMRYVYKNKDSGGPRRIMIWSGLCVGLWALAISWHVNITEYQSLTPITFLPIFDFGNWWIKSLMNLIIFFLFALFGVIYYFILFKLYDLAFSIAANFSVQLDALLIIRNNVKMKQSRFSTLFSGAARLRKKQGLETELTIDQQMQKKPLTKLRQTGKYKVMGYAYSPILAANLLSFLFLLIFLPTPTVSLSTDFLSVDILGAQLASIWDSGIWLVLDILQMLAMIYVAGIMSVAQREIGNTNTTRLLIGNLILVSLINFVAFMLRPTTGAGSWNIIANLSGNS